MFRVPTGQHEILDDNEDEVEVLAIRDENKIVGASSDCAKDLEVLIIVNQEEVCLVAQFLIATKQG